MKKVFVMILVFVMLTGMAGCGSPEAADTDGGKTAAAAGSTAGGTEKTDEFSGKLTFWHSFTQGKRTEEIQNIANRYAKEHPSVTLELEVFPWADFYTKWTTGLAAGNVPDISTAPTTQLVEMIGANAVDPLNDVIEDLGKDRFIQKPFNEYTVDGKIYGVPIYVNAMVMWYRKDLLDKAGLEVPTTWDELYKCAAALTDPAKNQYGIVVPMGVGDYMATRWLNFYVRSANTALMTKDGKGNLTDPAVIEGIKYWTKVYRECSPESAVNMKLMDMCLFFYSGYSAFSFDTGFHISGVQENRPDLLDDISCTEIPRMNAGDPSVNAENASNPIVLWKVSKNKEMAKDFIKSFFTEENYIPFVHSVPVGMIPVMPEFLDNPAYQANETVKMFSKEARIISDAVARGSGIGLEYGFTTKAGYLTNQSVIEKMFNRIVVDGVKVETAASEANDELNEILEAAK